jgi:hypothetical protein
LARQPGSISGETRLRAADQPIVTTQELLAASNAPLLAATTRRSVVQPRSEEMTGLEPAGAASARQWHRRFASRIGKAITIALLYPTLWRVTQLQGVSP